MALIQCGDGFLDTDKEGSLVVCPYGNKKLCDYHCAKLRIRKAPDGQRIAVFNCGGRCLELELYSPAEWKSKHPGEYTYGF